MAVEGNIMTKQEIEAISAVVRAYEVLNNTAGAEHYMDDSQTYTCGCWIASHLSNPIRELAKMVGIPLSKHI